MDGLIDQPTVTVLGCQTNTWRHFILFGQKHQATYRLQLQNLDGHGNPCYLPWLRFYTNVNASSDSEEREPHKPIYRNSIILLQYHADCQLFGTTCSSTAVKADIGLYAHVTMRLKIPAFKVYMCHISI